MNLSATASRFDSSISWLAAIGNHAALAGLGWDPADLPAQNQSTIVSVPLGEHDGTWLLRALSEQGVICSARDGNLRLAVHFYNHEDDIEQLVTALASPEVVRMAGRSV
jgi:selenocysteine lyase/cysteine desulfurase